MVSLCQGTNASHRPVIRLHWPQFQRQCKTTNVHLTTYSNVRKINSQIKKIEKRNLQKWSEHIDGSTTHEFQSVNILNRKKNKVRWWLLLKSLKRWLCLKKMITYGVFMIFHMFTHHVVITYGIKFLRLYQRLLNWSQYNIFFYMLRNSTHEVTFWLSGYRAMSVLSGLLDLFVLPHLG